MVSSHPMRARRKELGMSRADLAANAGISASQVKRIELGYSRCPHALTRVVLAVALRADPDALFGPEELNRAAPAAPARAVRQEPAAPPPRALDDEVAFWKSMARKHEARQKRAVKLSRRLIAELGKPDSSASRGVHDIAAQIDALYAEKRKATTGVGEPFIRPPSSRDPNEIIVVKSNKRPGPAPATVPFGLAR